MKGFTLIEIVAVVTMIAVFSIIAFPAVNNTINNIKENSLKFSAKNIEAAAEQTYFSNKKNRTRDLIFEFSNYEISSNFEDAKLLFNGKNPQNGNMIIRKDGKLSYSFHDGKYCTKKTFELEKAVVSIKEYDDCISGLLLPEITLIGENPQYVEINSVFIDSGVTAKSLDGSSITNVSIKYKKGEVIVPSISVNTLSEYKVIYTITDDGLSNFKERRIIVRDTIPPVITVPSNINIEVDEVDTFDYLSGIITSDNSLEVPSVTIEGSLARISGSYEVVYRATDSSGNSSSAIRYINVNDTGAPVITLNGAAVINLNIGSSYTELGATALDAVDGNLTSSIVISGTVNTNLPGTYFIVYTSRDSSNNESSITRTINVIDNNPPLVTFTPDGNEISAKNRSTIVSVTDANGTIVSSHYQWTTSTTAPTTASFTQSFTTGNSLTTPPLVTGTYYLWIKAVDNSGNETIKRSNVFNIDNTLPTVAFGTNGNATNAKTRSTTVTVSDVHGLVASRQYQWTTSTTSPTSASFSTIFTSGDTITTPTSVTGGYYLWIKAVDNSGNEVITRSNVFNLDNTLPTVTFGTNGNAVYAKSRSTSVDVADVHGTISVSQYQWTTSTTAPTSASFTTNFTSGTTIATPALVTGGYYLWIKAVDSSSNEVIIRSNVFNINNTAPIFANVSTGANRFADSNYISGNNSMVVYNNSSNGNVSHARLNMDKPSGNGFGIRITGIGAASPGHGGFYQIVNSAANGQYVHTIVAKIPVGYTIQRASNATGTGTSTVWLTSQNGTGNWQKYAYITLAGASGTFSSLGHVYLSGGAVPTSGAPLIWDVAYTSMTDSTFYRTTGSIVFRATSQHSPIVGYSLGTSSSPGTYTTIPATNNFYEEIIGINSNGAHYLWVIDDLGNERVQTVTVSSIDNAAPVVTFGTNGNATYAKTRSTTVTVSDVHSLVASRQYQWTTSTTAPTSASFSTVFTSGDTIATPVGVTGGYYLWIKAVDSLGNEIITRSNVFNLDNTIPVITRLGSNPININAGTSYTDAGATASDNINGNISGSIVMTGNVNVNVLGTYTLNYNVSDSSGNVATTVTRTVNVIDNTLPTVTFGTNGNAVYAKSRSTSVDVADVHGTISVSQYQWTTSTTAPTSASFSTAFTSSDTISTPNAVTGGYYLWIKAVDSSSNEIITRSNVFNIDNTLPVISSVVSGTTAIANNSFTITRSGNATDAHGGLAANPYIYQYSADGSNWSTSCTNNTTSCVVNGLTSGATYHYRICVDDLSTNRACVASKTVVTTAGADTTPPVVTFGTDGNATALPEQTTTVNVTDNVAVASRYYLWTDSIIQPQTRFFSSTFTNGQLLMAPYVYLPMGDTINYLWIYTTDTSGNSTIVRSNGFLIKAIVEGGM